MASADTNVLLRWALGDLPRQLEVSKRLLEGGETVYVADAALIEMGYVLDKVYGLERELVAGYIRAVMSLGQVNCNRALFSRVLPTYLEYPQLSLTDCCLAAYTEIDKNEPLYTFDRKLANQHTAATLLA